MLFQHHWTVGLTPIEITIVIIIWFIINLLITAIFLKLALGIVGAKHTDFGEVFVTAFVVTILSLLLFIWWILTIISLILIFYFIAKRHDIGFCMAIELLVVIALFVLLGIIGWTIGSIFGFP